MKNKKLQKILLCLSSIITLKMYVNHNLTYHSVYYATNLSHKEGTNPVLVMVARNFEKIELPSNYSIRSSGGFSGAKFLDGLNDTMSLIRVGEITVSKLHTSVYFDNKTGEYLYNSFYDKERVRRVQLTDTQRQEFLVELDEFLADIVEVQSKPIINLQWLFNSRYEKQFNE